MLYHHYLAIVILVSMYIYIQQRKLSQKIWKYELLCLWWWLCFANQNICINAIVVVMLLLPWNNENLPNLIYLFRLAQLGVRRQKISQNEIFFRLYYYQSSSYCSILILVHILNCNSQQWDFRLLVLLLLLPNFPLVHTYYYLQPQ